MRDGCKNIPATSCQAGVRAAFTLVELLVVIGIIALLISILLPALNRARESAQSVACASNLRQMGIGIQFYCNDHKGFYPTIDTANNGTPYAFWAALLHNGGYVNIASDGGPLSAPTGGVLRCPSRTYPEGWNPSIASVLWYPHFAPTVPGPMAVDLFQFFSADRVNLKSARVGTIPPDKILLGEVLPADFSAWIYYTPNYGYFGAVHGKKVNVLYVDGHVTAEDAAEMESKRVTFTY